MRSNELQGLPDNTAVSFGVKGGNVALGWAYGGITYDYPGPSGEPQCSDPTFIYTPYVKVPDWMTVQEAQEFLESTNPDAGLIKEAVRLIHHTRNETDAAKAVIDLVRGERS